MSIEMRNKIADLERRVAALEAASRSHELDPEAISKLIRERMQADGALPIRETLTLPEKRKSA